MSEVKEKIEKTIKDVKETTKNAKEAAKKTAKEIKESIKNVVDKKSSNVIETTKAKSWWNRILSAIVGAVLAVAAMFGITNNKVAEQKEMVKQIQSYTTDALNDIKAGNLSEAKVKLEQANQIGKNVVKEVKEVVDNVKNADKEDIKNTAIEGAKSAAKEDKK